MTLVNTILCAPHSAGQAVHKKDPASQNDLLCPLQVLQIDLFCQMCSLVGRDFGSGEARPAKILAQRIR